MCHSAALGLAGLLLTCLHGLGCCQQHVHVVQLSQLLMPQLTGPLTGPAAPALQAPAPEASDKVKAMLKERFKKFNEGLEGIYLRECAWTIPDAQLRSAVKRVIKQDLLPPYREFMRK